MCAAITVYIAGYIKIDETSSLKKRNFWNRAVCILCCGGSTISSTGFSSNKPQGNNAVAYF